MIEFREDPGNNLVYVKIKNMDNLTRKAIRQGWFELGDELRSNTNRDILRKPRRGQVYIFRGPGGRRRRHVASVPGEAHANMRGTLRRSLGYQIGGWESLEFGYMRNVPDYADFVENGTRRMEARPSIGNNVRGIIRNGQTVFLNKIIGELK